MFRVIDEKPELFYKEQNYLLFVTRININNIHMIGIFGGFFHIRGTVEPSSVKYYHFDKPNMFSRFKYRNGRGLHGPDISIYNYKYIQLHVA